MISAADGERAVHLARVAIDRSLDVAAPRGLPCPEGATLPRLFQEARGVFVTLKQYPGGALRGCIGYPLPVLPLGEAIREVAVAAATEDPRFPPVESSEMEHVTIDVSVLTLPQLVPATTPEDLVAAIHPGRDGLIVEGRGHNGLLLPQVATELGWDAEQLLEGTCEKAGLPSEAWRDRRVHVRRFEAEVFGELRPGGPVEREPTELAPPAVRAVH